MDVEQHENLERVTEAIGKTIIEFRTLVGLLHPFRCEEMRRFVINRYPHIAPASPDRILRQLRQQGKLDYQIVNRRGSLYEFTG